MKQIKNDTDLEPCPFCGGEAGKPVWDIRLSWVIWCKNCNGNACDEATEQDVIKRWNTRAHPVTKEEAEKQIKLLVENSNSQNQTTHACLNKAILLEKENARLRDALKEMVSIYKIVINHHKIKGIHPELEYAEQALKQGGN